MFTANSRNTSNNTCTQSSPWSRICVYCQITARDSSAYNGTTLDTINYPKFIKQLSIFNSTLKVRE